MRILYNITAIIILCSMAICCTKENTLCSKEPQLKFTASTECLPDKSRTSLQDDKYVLWSKGDHIIVFDKTDAGQAYRLDDNYVGLSHGEFSILTGVGTEGNGLALSNTIAYYPFSETITIEQNGKTYSIKNVTIPHEQKYSSAGPDTGSFPMIAINRNDEENISFKNICGIMRISLTGSNAISKITLRGERNEKLAGNATVTITEGSDPKITLDEDSHQSISLICDPAVELNEIDDTHFYISIPPSFLELGFTITVHDSNGNTFTKTASHQNTFKRSSILKMPAFKERPTSGKCVDLGLSVKWAGWNIGASSPEEDGYLYAWGETEPKSTYSFVTYLYLNIKTGVWSYLGDDISETQHDVAHVKWGNEWRMPTKSEADELLTLCTRENAEYNGINGYFFIGPNGNSIFMPNIISSNGDGSNGLGGYYWTSTFEDYYNDGAVACYMSIGENLTSHWYRSIGMPVRPVKE